VTEMLLIDLHLHTTCSDGVWPVQRLLDEVRRRSLDVFCISDHDSLDAYPIPEDLASRAISGLEVDSHHGGHTVHVLAYGVSDKNSPLLLALSKQRFAREERMASMVQAVRSHGIDVSMEDVRAQARGTVSLGRPHLARALVACGAVPNVQDAFNRYLADDAGAYVALERLTSARVIELIHLSGGVAIAAHPQRLHNTSDLPELIELGLDGIEIVHPTADEEMQRFLIDTVRSRGLLATGGTDFHAPVEGRPIGVRFPAVDVERLREAIDNRAQQ
jgi:3',5'-nucleoside bisphosphate phosphatase